VTYWLFVFLFDVNGEFQAREMIEAASMEQCEEFAAEYARTIINTQMQAQFYCVSDEEYRLAQDLEV
jgi:hypothetical protein